MKVIGSDFENIGHELNTLRDGILKLFCLEKSYKEAADKEDEKVDTIDGKEHISSEEFESNPNKKRFYYIF